MVGGKCRAVRSSGDDVAAVEKRSFRDGENRGDSSG